MRTFFSEPKTLREAIKPLVYLNWFLGLGIFRQPNHTAFMHFAMQLHTVIANTMRLIITYIGMADALQKLDYGNMSPMSIMMYKTLMWISSCIVVSTPLLVWIRKKSCRGCLQEMTALEDLFQSTLGIENNYKKLHTRINVRSIIGVLIGSIVSISDQAMNPDRFQGPLNIWDFCIFTAVHQQILIIILLDLIFCVSIECVREKFRSLNDNLLKLARQTATLSSNESLSIAVRVNVNTTPRNGRERKPLQSMTTKQYYFLRKIRKAHWELCKLAKQINDTFGLQNLMFMGISFVMITGLLYTIYSAYTWHNSTRCKTFEITASTVWVAVFTSHIWMICHLCCSTSNEAQRTREILCEFSTANINDAELQTEVDKFAVQTSQNPVKFDACGFFYMDYTFVQSVIGSITTYLVILIQMSGRS
ncbi:gustatory receptor for sugar taste 43a-like [Neodiprion pinetum]|uniref:gustatory receptor for sugar taste 43a-like n=1 Tax=Neodiprion pinetum TaxID=441929 RepID=UPI001EDD48B7|nr:gustatory receptor for sugar taste 43a-like [Neodiprion pinetum]